MKILFLDFDGVLNSHRFWEKCAARGLTPAETSDQLDPDAIKRLNRIVKETPGGCMVVVSSTWRRLPETNTPEKLEAVLKKFGYEGTVFGITPYDSRCDWHDGTCSEGHRGGEINQWLIEHSYIPVTKFAIVDDDGDMGPLKDRLVQTGCPEGLTDLETAEIIELLR